MISDEQHRRVVQQQSAREQYLRARSAGFEEEARLDRPTSLAGYHLHPLLVIFPLTVLLASVALDIVYLVGGHRVVGEVATWLLLPGIVGGFAAAVVGTMDWWRIPAGTSSKSTGAWHGLGNVASLSLFALSWISSAGSGAEPGVLGLLLAFTGASVMLMTGWLGGELANRVGVTLAPAPDRLAGDTVIEPLGPELVEPVTSERQAAHA
jgi:uncharacterized membrane protein